MKVQKCKKKCRQNYFPHYFKNEGDLVKVHKQCILALIFFAVEKLKFIVWGICFLAKIEHPPCVEFLQPSFLVRIERCFSRERDNRCRHRER